MDELLKNIHAEKDLKPAPLVDRATWLRRVTYDLVGLPPTLDELNAFLGDASAEAYSRVVDRLLDSPQHGVRYARHWLDVLRYTDVDEGMPAGRSLYLWRDWVIQALNRNLPYDAFVRTQITGLEERERTSINALGIRRRLQPRLENMFALGFLSRGASSSGNGNHALAMSAVETISTAFLGMTTGCAKCHDHFFDPISQEDYYRMKALFDPLKLRDIPLATAPQIIEYGTKLREYEAAKTMIDEEIAAIEAPFRTRLYDERVGMLPDEIQGIIRKSFQERTAEEQKIADDYFPVLRIDVGKIREVMSDEIRKNYDDVRGRLNELARPAALPSFLTVEEDAKRREELRYVLSTGDAGKPEKDRRVTPGFLFEPEGTEYSEGLRETFVDWLSDPQNGLFARVAVNRIWQWHFGRGLHDKASDFGSLAGEPRLRTVLDGLAAAFVAHDFDMKWLHREIVLSDAYRRSSAIESEAKEANSRVDPKNEFYWRFPVQRLEAEAIQDAILALAEHLDMTVGGPSYAIDEELKSPQRRAAYLKRGYRARENLLPEFLDAFDAEDGKESCARREETVTAPQALWLMNNPLVHRAASQFGSRLERESEGDLLAAIRLGYRAALTREPEAREVQVALAHLDGESKPFERLAWLLVNLDEFIYLP